MNRIPQLSEIAVSLDEAIELNNSIPSPLAYVFNKWKNTPEFELKPVEKVKDEVDLKPEYTGVWETHPSEVFVAMEQINELINQNHFFYAPLKLTGKEPFVQTSKE